MAYTCPTELADVVRSAPIDSTLNVERHVAWDYCSSLHGLSDFIGAPIRWVAETFDSNEVWGQETVSTLEALEDVVGRAETLYAINADGVKVTPTFSL